MYHSPFSLLRSFFLWWFGSLEQLLRSCFSVRVHVNWSGVLHGAADLIFTAWNDNCISRRLRQSIYSERAENEPSHFSLWNKQSRVHRSSRHPENAGGNLLFYTLLYRGELMFGQSQISNPAYFGQVLECGPSKPQPVWHRLQWGTEF